MASNLLEIISGFFLLFFMILSFYIGIKISLKYKEGEKVEFITFGLTWIFLTTTLLIDTINFISLYVFAHSVTGKVDRFITPYTIPLASIFWIYSMLSLFPSPKKKMFLIFIYSLSLFYMLLNTILLIMESIFLIDLNYIWNPVQILYLIFISLLFLITGVIFCYKSLKAKEIKIRAKGSFLLIGFILFFIAAFLMVIDFLLGLEGNIEYNFYIRLFLLTPSAISYYLGFFLPSRLENWLYNRIKQEN